MTNPFPIRNTIPTPPRRPDLAGRIRELRPGQSFFVPGLLRGYQLASRFRKVHNIPVRAMRDVENGVKGTVFWREKEETKTK